MNTEMADITITCDPQLNGGAPTVAERGVALIDVLSRLDAGEPLRQVAFDYDLDPAALATLMDRLSLDRETGARYLTLTDQAVASTVQVDDCTLVDTDAEGHVVGIEILGPR